MPSVPNMANRTSRRKRAHYRRFSRKERKQARTRAAMQKYLNWLYGPVFRVLPPVATGTALMWSEVA